MLIRVVVHIEGTLTPELLIKFATRNGISIPFKNLEEAQKAYDSLYDLKSFLELYYANTKVINQSP